MDVILNNGIVDIQQPAMSWGRQTRVKKNKTNSLIINSIAVFSILLFIVYSQTSLAVKNKIIQKNRKKTHLIQKIALKQDSYFNLIANILKFLPQHLDCTYRQS